MLCFVLLVIGIAVLFLSPAMGVLFAVLALLGYLYPYQMLAVLMLYAAVIALFKR